MRVVQREMYQELGGVFVEGPSPHIDSSVVILRVNPQGCMNASLDVYGSCKYTTERSCILKLLFNVFLTLNSGYLVL